MLRMRRPDLRQGGRVPALRMSRRRSTRGTRAASNSRVASAGRTATGRLGWLARGAMSPGAESKPTGISQIATVSCTVPALTGNTIRIIRSRVGVFVKGRREFRRTRSALSRVSRAAPRAHCPVEGAQGFSGPTNGPESGPEPEWPEPEKWRKRLGIEPSKDAFRSPPTDLKSARAPSLDRPPACKMPLHACRVQALSDLH